MRHIGAFTLTSLQQSVLIVLVFYLIFYFFFAAIYIYNEKRPRSGTILRVHRLCCRRYIWHGICISFLFSYMKRWWVYERKIVAIRASFTHKHKNCTWSMTLCGTENGKVQQSLRWVLVKWKCNVHGYQMGNGTWINAHSRNRMKFGECISWVVQPIQYYILSTMPLCHYVYIYVV